MRRHLVLSLVVSAAAISGAFGMRAYIGHPAERVIEHHTVETAPGAHASAGAPRRKQGSVRDHVASDRRAPSKRQPGDDIADELNKLWPQQ